MRAHVRLPVMFFAVALVTNAGCSAAPPAPVEGSGRGTAPSVEADERAERVEREIAGARNATPERVAFHIENLSRRTSHHCTTWARDPGCREITCPLTAGRYLYEVACNDPVLLVPYLRDRREAVSAWVRGTLLGEYGDDALLSWEVEHPAYPDEERRNAAAMRLELFVEKWESFANGSAVLPRRSPATRGLFGTFPRCWPSRRPPTWWPEDGAEWPRVHPAPTCCEGGSVVPDGNLH